MEDIVKRLRGWRNVHLARGGELFESAADEIERLKWRLTVRQNIIGRLVAENERLRNGNAQRPPTVINHNQGEIAWDA
jgi:hypothetical protein